jgi:acyl dehydratase
MSAEASARALPGYDLWLDDFKPGDAFETEGLTVTESMIIDFSLQWDPQSSHMNVHAKRTEMLGGLMASGFLTLCITFRSFLGSGILDASNLASPGFDKLRWLKPVRPGDTLRVVSRVISATPSRSKPDRGALLMSHETYNQNGEMVLSCECAHFLRRRPMPVRAAP